MNRKKQLLTWILTFVLAFSSMPAVSLFATDYDVKSYEGGIKINWVPSEPTILQLGDTIEDSGEIGNDKGYIIMYYGEYNDQVNIGKISLEKGKKHIILNAAEFNELKSYATPAGKKLVGWTFKQIIVSGGSIGEIFLAAIWQDAYTVTYDINSGTGTAPDKSEGYIEGESVSLPDTTGFGKEGYAFAGWAAQPDAAQPLTSYTMETDNITLYAVWQPKYQMTYQLQNVSVVGNQPSQVTTSQMITLKADTGYKLPAAVNVQIAGDVALDYSYIPATDGSNTASLEIRSITGAVKLTAIGVKIPASSGGSGGGGSSTNSSTSSSADTYTITAVAEKGGTITPAGDTTVKKGEDKSFTVKPDEWYRLSKLLVDDKEVNLETEDTYTFKKVNAAHTIKAVFDKKYKALAKGTASFKIGESKYLANGKEVSMDAASYIQKPGYTMLPVRYVLEAFGIGEGDILCKDNTITINSDGKIIQLTIDSDEALVNGASLKLGTQVVVKEGRTYVPVGEIARLLGIKTSWDKVAKTAVFINE